MSDATVRVPPGVADGVAAYVREVRSALADLPAEDVDELTGGMEADLTELAGDCGGDLAYRLGSPIRYAAELRGAAGLPVRVAGPGTPAAVAAGVCPGVRGRGRGRPAGPRVVAADGGAAPGARRRQRGRCHRGRDGLGIGGWHLLRGRRLQPDPGGVAGGAQVGNIFVYDAGGKRLNCVRLFAAAGQPLGGAEDVFGPAGGPVGVVRDSSGAPVTNVYPRALYGQDPWQVTSPVDPGVDQGGLWTSPMSIVPLMPGAAPTSTPAATASARPAPSTSARPAPSGGPSPSVTPSGR